MQNTITAWAPPARCTPSNSARFLLCCGAVLSVAMAFCDLRDLFPDRVRVCFLRKMFQKALSYLHFVSLLLLLLFSKIMVVYFKCLVCREWNESGGLFLLWPAGGIKHSMRKTGISAKRQKVLQTLIKQTWLFFNRVHVGWCWSFPIELL